MLKVLHLNAGFELQQKRLWSLGLHRSLNGISVLCYWKKSEQN